MAKYLSRDLKVLSIAFFFIFMGASFQQFLIPYLQNATSWGPMKCSTILMVVYSAFLFWRVFVVYSIPLLGDYFSILIGSLTYTGFVATLYLTRQYPVLLLASFIWGWGAASMWIVSSTQVLDAARESRYGMASGFFYAATHAGFALGVLILGRMGARFGNGAILLTAIAAISIGNLTMLFVPRKRVQREKDIRTIFSMMKTTKVRNVGFFLFASSLGFGFLLGAFTGMARDHGMLYLANSAFFFPLARFILSFFGGVLSDKLGSIKTMFLAFIISAFGLLFAGIWLNIATAAFSSFSLGLQGGLVPVAANAIIGDSASTERRHLAFGALFVWRDLGVAFSLFLGQYLQITFGGFKPTFLAFAGIFMLCALLSIGLLKSEDEKL